VREVGVLTLPLLANPQYVQGFRLVSEAEVGQAMRQLSPVCGKLVEPAGALAYAAACKHASQLWRQARPGDAPTLFITPVCGANVTKQTYEYFKNKAIGE
jgi:threonine dehydratase